MARKKSGKEQFFGGLTALGVFAVLWFVFSDGQFGNPFKGDTWWLIFPFLFIAVIPMASGIRRMLSQSRRSKEDEQRQIAEKSTSAEKVALRVAKNNRGIVTPSLVALESNVSLEEADRTLQSLAGRGYAEMRVRDSGVIEYAFPDLDGGDKKRN